MLSDSFPLRVYYLKYFAGKKYALKIHMYIVFWTYSVRVGMCCSKYRNVIPIFIWLPTLSRHGKYFVVVMLAFCRLRDGTARKLGICVQGQSLAFATAFFFYHGRNDSDASTATAALPHSGLYPSSNKLNLPEVISQLFPNNSGVTWFPFPVIVYASYSKIVKLLYCKNMVRQFDEFFSLNFWRVFDVWPKCVPDAC